MDTMYSAMVKFIDGSTLYYNDIIFIRTESGTVNLKHKDGRRTTLPIRNIIYLTTNKINEDSFKVDEAPL